MNIFVLDKDPHQAAWMVCDKHCVKMIVEGCQMLSTIHHMDGNSDSRLYKPSFKNHPCTIWARETKSNYMWLAGHTLSLSMQYTLRYGKTHKAHELCMYFVQHTPSFIPEGELTAFAQAMPDKYRCNDAVTAYRNYYIGEKAKFAKWKIGNIPDWFIQGVNLNVSVPVLQS
jgi:hypothetical protein